MIKYQRHKKLNTAILSLLVSCQVLVILGIIYAMDWFRKPSYIGYVLIAGAAFQAFRLVRKYRKPRLEKEW